MAINDHTARLHHEQTANLPPSDQTVLRELSPLYQAVVGEFPSGPGPVTTMKVDRATLAVTQEQRPESPLEYRGRLLKTIQEKTGTYPNHDFLKMASRDGAAARRLEQDILREAPRKIPVLREVRVFDVTGRQTTEFVGGSPKQWMQSFTQPVGRRATKWKDG